jgi:hypothetical protein
MSTPNFCNLAPQVKKDILIVTLFMLAGGVNSLTPEEVDILITSKDKAAQIKIIEDVRKHVLSQIDSLKQEYNNIHGTQL